ncbi:MAG: HlyD family efflux transporter periplasmic adaptor subunit [Proteobacteria bacterium]|nr:HlyD family efflux transporter periplasmic adaptor subunit [Pseudomonadota bacterium]
MKRTLATLLAIALLAGCESRSNDYWQGYIEGEYMLLAAPAAGQLQKLYVRRGEQAEAGKPMFALEQESERAARLQAEEQLKSAEARLDNLRAGRRAPEVASLRAAVTQAKAALALSSSQLAQQQKLFKGGFIAQAVLDQAQSAHARDAALLKGAEAQLRTALQPLGREDERKAAEGDVAAARAAVAQAAWRLEQKSIAAPASGLVQDTFFVEGEWVPAGKPVVSLLPPGNVKARFYAPQAALSALAPGRTVEIRCDGCPAPFAAKVSFVSSQAEYTPPVLYSRESRTKLLFLIEARLEPADGVRLRPGQPVDVRLK